MCGAGGYGLPHLAGMSTLPNVPDADRIVTYTPNNSVGPFSVPFLLFDNTGADLVVELNGYPQAGNWSLSVGTDPGFWGAPNTFINGTVTFTAPVSGTLVIRGKRRPRRVSQYSEGRGVPARDLNTELNMLTAITRELRQDLEPFLVRFLELDQRVAMAVNAANSAAASFDAFDDRYLGPKATLPTVDNDGQPLLAGAIIFHTATNQWKVWNGAAWQAEPSPPDGSITDAKIASAGLSASKVNFVPELPNGVARPALLKLRDVYHIKDWGAVGDGVADDLPAFNKMLSDLRTYRFNGAEVWVDPGAVHRITAPLVIGSGSASGMSTLNGLKLKALGGGGTGEGEFGYPRGGARILYDGPATGFMGAVQFEGPIHSVGLENIVIDSNQKATRGLILNHVYKGHFKNVSIEKWSINANSIGVYLTVRSPLPPGTTQGCMDNVFESLNVRDPRGVSGIGLYLEGGESSNVGNSRNLFINTHVIIPGDATSRGVALAFADNNTFMRLTASHSGNGGNLGRGLGFYGSTTIPGFPQENLFMNVSLQGGIVTSGDPGYNLIVGYNLSDGAPLPEPLGKIKVITTDGRIFGGMSGSIVPISGNSPAAGLGVSSKYFPVSGTEPGNAETSAYTILPVGGIIRKLNVRLNTAPGGVATRTFALFKNGVDTGLGIVYGAGQSGDRAATSAAGIAVNGGDRLSLFSGVTDTPVESFASWSVALYPNEAP